MRNLSDDNDDGEYDPVDGGFNLNISQQQRQQQQPEQQYRIQHDYVIVGKKIESR